MKMAGISDGAKRRLFKMAIKANDALENASDDDEYTKLKKRSDEWNEILMLLGLSNDLRQFYEERNGRQE